jgi:hypothetical protein
MPGPEGRVLRILSDDRILDEGVTKVVDDLGDSEDAAEALVETFLVCAAACREVPTRMTAKVITIPTDLTIDAINYFLLFPCCCEREPPIQIAPGREPSYNKPINKVVITS